MSKKSFTAISLLAVLGSFSLAHAVTPTTTDTLRMEQRLEERVKEGCEKLEAGIEAKIALFNANKRAHVTAYNIMMDRIKKVGENLKEKGYDTKKLQSDLQMLNRKVLKYANDYTNYMGKLSETQEYACGKSDGEFRAKLASAKEALKVVQEDVNDIKNYYETAIRADLADLKNQTPNP